MAKNIYDLFNERKNGIDYLVEGLDPTEYNDLEGYEDLDAAAEALDVISMESMNEMLEFQAANYLEDLVLENMMYDEFDEEKIQNLMEAAKEEKKEGLGQKIKNLWQKIKEWFARAFKTIVNHFQSGETLVAKYKKEIPRAMAQSNAKIKAKPFGDPDAAVANVKGMVGRLKVVGRSKEQILGLVGVTDKNGVKEKVDKLFFTGDATEKPINGLKADVVMKWAGNKKIFIDTLKKCQKDVDGEFKQMLADINKGEGKNKAEDAANFQFGIGIANALLSQSIVCVKQISNICTAIIRKALSGKYDPDKEKDITAAATKDRKDELRFNKKASDAGFKPKDANAMSRKKLGGEAEYPAQEAWEIIDEEEDNNNDDNFEW